MSDRISVNFTATLEESRLQQKNNHSRVRSMQLHDPLPSHPHRFLQDVNPATSINKVQFFFRLMSQKVVIPQSDWRS